MSGVRTVEGCVMLSCDDVNARLPASSGTRVKPRKCPIRKSLADLKKAGEELSDSCASIIERGVRKAHSECAEWLQSRVSEDDIPEVFCWIVERTHVDILDKGHRISDWD